MHPIVSALKHHKTTVALVALEIALTCAIVTNALFVIGDRLAAMHMQTGVADNELVWASVSDLDLGGGATTAGGTSLNPQGDHAWESKAAADLAALRGMPGVKSVVMSNALPLGGSYWSMGIYRRPGDKKSGFDNVVEYLGTPGMLKTLGIKLSEGRDFLPQEYVDYDPFQAHQAMVPPAAIVTRHLAELLWPGQDPLGRPVYWDDEGKRVSHVVGVVDHLLNPAINKYQGVDRGLIFPVKAVKGGMYVLRVDPASRDAVARDLPKVLTGVNPDRIVTDHHVYAQTVSAYFHDDRALIWLLAVVIGCLLALTTLGVVGLSSFWVQQRTRQIGVRRAIGATRRDILRYFQLENLLIVSLGVVLGSLSAVGLNLWLMKHYELPHMPLAWVGAGAVVLWAIGQLAVLGPALRAAAVPPVVATRSV